MCAKWILLFVYISVNSIPFWFFGKFLSETKCADSFGKLVLRTGNLPSLYNNLYDVGWSSIADCIIEAWDWNIDVIQVSEWRNTIYPKEEQKLKSNVYWKLELNKRNEPQDNNFIVVYMGQSTFLIKIYLFFNGSEHLDDQQLIFIIKYPNIGLK